MDLNSLHVHVCIITNSSIRKWTITHHKVIASYRVYYCIALKAFELNPAAVTDCGKL